MVCSKKVNIRVSETVEDAAEKVAPDNKKSELRDVASEVVIPYVLLIITTDNDNKGLS